MPDEPEKAMIYGNGIAEDGDYGLIIDVDTLYASITGHDELASPAAAAALGSLQAKGLGAPANVAAYARDLKKTHWGIIWPDQATLTPAEQTHLEALRAALSSLIEFRMQEMGETSPYEFTCKPEWDFASFLWEQGLGAYEFDPDVVPYYLLIVASPEQISWEFQEYLDTDYAVGRLWFDNAADCQAYVEHLLAYEKHQGPAPAGRQVLLFGPQHGNDLVSTRTSTVLVPDIQKWLIDHNAEYGFGYELLVASSAAGSAVRENLVRRLSGTGLGGQPSPRPAFLFTAGHGMEYRAPCADQYSYQGALICQDWPSRYAAIQRAHYLAGEDVAGLDLSGMFAFCFACFSAGTPQKSDWDRPNLLGQLPDVADPSFVARLPQKMLAQGAIGYIGHVSRAWDSSFLGPDKKKPQAQLFTETLGQLVSGQRAGHATNWLNERWLKLTAMLEEKKGTWPKQQIVDLWMARNDLRGYVLLGDPAARIRTELYD